MKSCEYMISAKIENLPEMVKTTERILSGFSLSKKVISKILLLVEDMLVELVNHKSNDDAEISIGASYFLGKGKLLLKCRGQAFELENTDMGLQDALQGDYTENEEAAVRAIIRKNLGIGLSLENERNVNIITIQFDSAKYLQLIVSMLSLVLGLLSGYLMRVTCSENICNYISSNVFSNISDMFLKAIKLVVAPLIFFSMASSVAGMGNIKALGRLGGKVFLMYLFTSLVAIFLALGIFQLLPLSDSNLPQLIGVDASATDGLATIGPVSVWNVIKDIVPSNFIRAFLDANMLQIIFLAFLLGGVSTIVGEASLEIRHGLEVLNTLFVKVATAILKCMPLAIFASMAKLMINIDFAALASMLKWIGLNYMGFAALQIFYAFIILVLARKNPLIFFKKYFEPMATAFTFNASSAALPSALKCCRDKLGISPKVYSFSIPLGNTINMDGCCTMMIITTFFFAKSFGLELTPGVIVSLIATVYLLSVGSPGVPMGALVCVSLIFNQIGLPKEALTLIMGLYPVVAMFMTWTNVAGDGTVTLIVAKKEGLLDDKVYNEK
ncbi:MAG: dicarboxylate/amino acid:cation symporter [Treponema sp.]|nr:dicarboxylate/amino acid:cation symporter [Treponema sp.]